MRKALSPFFLFYAPKTLFLELSEIRKRALNENLETTWRPLKIFLNLSILQCRFGIILNYFFKANNFIRKLSNFYPNKFKENFKNFLLLQRLIFSSNFSFIFFSTVFTGVSYNLRIRFPKNKK